MTLSDLSGQTFGKLLVLERVPSPNKRMKQSFWRCRCECGTERVIPRTNLTSKNTKTCGQKSCTPKKTWSF